jgi:hypothetical protein
MKVGRMLRQPAYDTQKPLLITVPWRDPGITYLLRDVEDVFRFYREHSADGPKWEQYMATRRQLIEEIMGARRRETRLIKRWMFEHYLLKDRTDIYYV